MVSFGNNESRGGLENSPCCTSKAPRCFSRCPRPLARGNCHLLPPRALGVQGSTCSMALGPFCSLEPPWAHGSTTCPR